MKRVGDTTDLDQDLHLRLVAKDERALRELMTVYGERVFRYALRLTHNEAIAEEVVNDVVLQVWESASKYQGKAKLSTWILGITRHLALNAVRSKAAKASTVDIDLLAEPADEVYDIEQGVHVRQQEAVRTAIRGALREMSMEHRDVLELTFYHGCSYREIAEIVGCPAATVRTRMYYAKRLLREALEALGDSQITDIRGGI